MIKEKHHILVLKLFLSAVTAAKSLNKKEVIVFRDNVHTEDYFKITVTDAQCCMYGEQKNIKPILSWIIIRCCFKSFKCQEHAQLCN